jgi:hypothetical protein
MSVRRFLASNLALQDACSLLSSPSSLGSDSGRGGGWSLSRGLRGASACVPAGRCRGQSRPCQRGGRGVRTILTHPFFGRRKVTLAEHDRLRWAQGGVAQAGVERFQVRSPVAEPRRATSRFLVRSPRLLGPTPPARAAASGPPFADFDATEADAAGLHPNKRLAWPWQRHGDIGHLKRPAALVLRGRPAQYLF